MSSLLTGNAPLRKYPVIISKSSIEPSSNSSSTSKICPTCSLCTSTTYICSYCSSVYCGSACFKSHNSGKCNESFSKRKVQEHEALRKNHVKDDSNDPKNDGISSILNREFEGRREDDLTAFNDADEIDLEALEKIAQSLESQGEEDMDVHTLLSSMPEGLRSEFLASLKITDATDDDITTSAIITDIESVSNFISSLPPFSSLLPKTSLHLPDLSRNIYAVLTSYNLTTFNSLTLSSFESICPIFSSTSSDLNSEKTKETIRTSYFEIALSKGYKIPKFENKLVQSKIARREIIGVLSHLSLRFKKGKKFRKVIFYASWMWSDEGFRMWSDFNECES